MHLLNNIDHLASAPGVVAVAVASAHTGGGEHTERPCDFAGAADWQWRLRAALLMHHEAGEIEVRVTFGEHTIFVQREGDQVAAVVVPTGHEICKSLRRMIKRAAKSPAKARRAAAASIGEIQNILAATESNAAREIAERDATIATLKEALDDSEHKRIRVRILEDRTSIVAFIKGEAARFDAAARTAVLRHIAASSVFHDDITVRLTAQASIARTLAAQIERGDDRNGADQ